MNTSIEVFLNRLDEIVGARGEYHLITEKSETPPVWAIIYKDCPETGAITGFTFGLSSVDDPRWKYGRPELVISVSSSNIDWGLAIGFSARKLRGKCPFSYGTTVRFGGAICNESQMSAFFIFIPTILDQAQTHMELPDRVVNVVQAYPIYDDEVALIERIGASTFFSQEGLDLYNVRRPNTARGLAQ
jgi:hypothetical protein